MLQNSPLCASLEHLLPHVVRPARYTGNEWNSVRKEWPGRLHVALAYPDVYEEGICSYWTLALYDRLNRERDILCERAYLPWPDMDDAMRQAGLPLFALESTRPLADFDVILIVLPGERHYPAVLTLLHLAGLPLRSSDRQGRNDGLWSRPLVIGVGPGTANPEPLADFFDAFIVGEVDAHIVRTTADGPGHALPALYFPRLYNVIYGGDGTIATIEPRQPVVVHRRASLPPPLTRPIVPYVEAGRERAVVELAYAPLYPWSGEPWRERPVDEILATVESVLVATGYDHVHLVGQHTRLAEITERLSARYAGMHIHFSLDTVKPTVQAIDVADRLPRISRAWVLDVAACSERLRKLGGSETSDEEIGEAARLAFRRGCHILRLSLAVGLPGETIDDVKKVVALARHVRDIGHAEIDGRAQVHVVATPFIPRAHSRWERMAMPVGDDWTHRVELLTRGIRGPSLRLVWRGVDMRLVDAALARGDRRLGSIIEAVWHGGVRRPSENEKSAAWQVAFTAAGVDLACTATRERPLDELLPWQHISVHA